MKMRKSISTLIVFIILGGHLFAQGRIATENGNDGFVYLIYNQDDTLHRFAMEVEVVDFLIKNESPRLLLETPIEFLYYEFVFAEGTWVVGERAGQVAPNFKLLSSPDPYLIKRQPIKSTMKIISSNTVTYECSNGDIIRVNLNDLSRE